ncbi:MAG: hypothetical protein K9M54_09545 [Kiritimatiellales bacterium]|nr:hypothetical protein [Kiritimatiellales bacterium]
METISPNKIRSGLSGMLYSITYVIMYISGQCLVAQLFGEKYQYLKLSLIIFPPIAIIGGFIGGLLGYKRRKISIQNYTISQNKSHVALKSVGCKPILFGIQIFDDAKHKIRCTGFHFSRESIDRLKQTINCEPESGAYLDNAR